MNGLDLKKFTFNEIELQALGELLVDHFFTHPEFAGFHTLYSGIKADQQIGWVGEGSIVGRAAQGCDPEYDEFSVATRLLTWRPKHWEVPLRFCANDLDSLIAKMSLNLGNDRFDLTNTAYMSLIVEALQESMRRMFWRFLWFSDTDATNVADGGIITDGVDVRHFNLLDGFWKQIFDATEGTNRSIDIAANTAATEAAQIDNLTGDMAIDTLKRMWRHASTVLRTCPDLIGMCTSSFADGYALWFQDKAQESQIRRTVDGVDFMRYNGVDIVVLPVWDELIRAYENNRTKLNNPHRVMFLPKSILGVGFPGASPLTGINMFYTPATRFTHVESMGAIDALLLNPEMLVLGA